MKIKPFALELYFAKYEFTSRYMLCASDCESMSIENLLSLSGVSQDVLLQAGLGYTESQGDEGLREQIAALYPNVTASEIVFLSAPEEGIFTAMHALLNPGDHVIVLSPVYESLLNLAREITGNVSLWPFHMENGQWMLDEDELYNLATPQTKALIVNFPHNPTGYLPTEEMFKRILDWAAGRGIIVFSDEMYRGLELAPRTTLPSAVEINPNALVLSGLSKTYGLPGLRAGWLIVKDTVLRESILNWKMYTTICAARPNEVLAGIALQCRETLAQRSRDIIRENIAGSRDFFHNWEHLFNWIPPQAGSVAFVGLHQPSASVFCDKLAQDGFLLLPSAYMNFDDRHIRFGLGRKSFLPNLQELHYYLSTRY